MRARPRVSLLVVALAVAVGCGPRQVEVRTAPSATSTQTVNITNNLSQAVNVYIAGTGTNSDTFLRQVPANTVESVAVPAEVVGKTVTFKAVTVDGARTYQSRSVLYSGSFIWSVP